MLTCSEPDCRTIVRQSGSEQSPTENKTSRTLFFSVLSAIIKIARPPSRHVEKKATTAITVNLDRRQATDC
jgi:hypothetical protein